MILKILLREIRYVFSVTKRFFISPKFPKNKDGKILIHIGCGDIKDSCFVNIDARPMEHIHYVTKNVDNLSFLPSKSVDLLYMCHVMEHFDRAKSVMVTKECFRVLKHGGILRISVPDFDRIVDIYLDNNRNMKAIIAPLFGGQDYEFNYHYNMFNRESLGELFKQCGFRITREWKPDDVQYHKFDDWSRRKFSVDDKKYIISLNLEAVK